MHCAEVMVPPATELAMQYYNGGNWLWVFNLLLGFAIPLLFLVTKWTGRLEAFSRKIGRNWYFTIVVYWVLYVLITQALTLPLDFYEGFTREHAYGLSNQTLRHWWTDFGTSLLLSLVGGAAFLWIFYLLLKKSPHRWWIWGSLVSILLSFFLLIVQPIWIDPLFNQFGPMKNKELEGEILALASKAGISGSRVFEVNKSQETKTLNAYVIGFGATKRIVLWDTIIEKLSPDQLLFVVGHEMGHYVLGHIWISFIFMSGLAVALFYLVYRTGEFVMRRYKLGFSLDHVASLPLFLLTFNVLLFLFSPLSNWFSRHLEHQADRFGLEITHKNQAAGEAFVILQQTSLSNPWPGPLFNLFRNTHPPLGERVEYTNHYCPWKKE